MKFIGGKNTQKLAIKIKVLLQSSIEERKEGGRDNGAGGEIFQIGI